MRESPPEVYPAEPAPKTCPKTDMRYGEGEPPQEHGMSRSKQSSATGPHEGFNDKRPNQNMDPLLAPPIPFALCKRIPNHFTHAHVQAGAHAPAPAHAHARTHAPTHTRLKRDPPTHTLLRDKRATTQFPSVRILVSWTSNKTEHVRRQ